MQRLDSSHSLGGSHGLHMPRRYLSQRQEGFQSRLSPLTRGCVDDAHRTQRVPGRRDHRRAHIASDKWRTGHERIAAEARIHQRVANIEDAGLANRMRAKGRVARRCLNVESNRGPELLPVAIDERNGGNWRIE